MMSPKRVILLLLVIAAFTTLWYLRALTPVDGGDDARQAVTIPQGATAGDIASILGGKGIIRSSFAFGIYTRYHKVQAQMKAGGYVFRKSQGVPEIVTVLTRGFGEEATVTIPEGYTVADIDVLLAEQGIIESGALVTCAQTCDFSAFTFLPSPTGLLPRGGRVEGYLYPDTYFILKDDFEPQAFLERLLTTFRKRVVESLATDIDASGHTLHEIITMASLIEEETRNAEERPVVSGILWKRLDAGMSLGVDAAVRYALSKQSAPLTKDDLAVDSPYNLRKVRGLPPGPIANPSLSSIEAALRPEETTYWYYLHDSQGTIHYAVTNDEHNENRARYLSQ